MRITSARTGRVYSKYNRAPEPPRRHIPVVRDGVTLTNPLDDTERVLGEGRGLNSGRRGLLWAGIGAASGAASWGVAGYHGRNFM